MQIDEEKQSNSLYSTLSYYKNWLDIRADPSQLSVGEMIAAGAFKQVFEGTYAGEPVAISVFNGTASMVKKNRRKSKLLARELRAMNMLSNHPCVPRFHGYCLSSVTSKQDQIVLVSELCDRGDLANFAATDEFDGMTLKDRMMLCVDILRVLSVMHDEGLYHRMLLMAFVLTR